MCFIWAVTLVILYGCFWCMAYYILTVFTLHKTVFIWKKFWCTVFLISTQMFHLFPVSKSLLVIIHFISRNSHVNSTFTFVNPVQNTSFGALRVHLWICASSNERILRPLMWFAFDYKCFYSPPCSKRLSIYSILL